MVTGFCLVCTATSDAPKIVMAEMTASHAQVQAIQKQCGLTKRKIIRKSPPRLP